MKSPPVTLDDPVAEHIVRAEALTESFKQRQDQTLAQPPRISGSGPMFGLGSEDQDPMVHWNALLALLAEEQSKTKQLTWMLQLTKKKEAELRDMCTETQQKVEQLMTLSQDWGGISGVQQRMELWMQSTDHAVSMLEGYCAHVAEQDHEGQKRELQAPALTYLNLSKFRPKSTVVQGKSERPRALTRL